MYYGGCGSGELVLFASLSRRGLGTRTFDSCAKAPPAKRSKKGYGDENQICAETPAGAAFSVPAMQKGIAEGS